MRPTPSRRVRRLATPMAVALTLMLVVTACTSGGGDGGGGGNQDYILRVLVVNEDAQAHTLTYSGGAPLEDSPDPETVESCMAGVVWYAAELPFVFNTPVGIAGNQSPPWNEAEKRVAEAMIGYWVQFAKTGDPNREGLPAWPKFDAGSESYLELGERIEAGKKLCEQRCETLDGILATVRTQEQQTGGR